MFDRTYQVRLQADLNFATSATTSTGLRCATRDGKMVPLGAVATVKPRLGPTTITRYNLYPAASITGKPAPGVSTGQAIELMGQIAAPSVAASRWDYDWTGHRLSGTSKSAIRRFMCLPWRCCWCI